MKRTFLVNTVAIVSMTAVGAFADECPESYTETAVSGSVSTINISETQQFGSIEMQLTNTNKKGKVLFDESGTLIGTITNQTLDDYGRPVSILSHTINFEGGSTIETVGDEATIVSATSACSFIVEEVISNFWGTQSFKRATGEIRADGNISFPDYCENQNTFVLSGTVCLFKGRK